MKKDVMLSNQRLKSGKRIPVFLKPNYDFITAHKYMKKFASIDEIKTLKELANFTRFYDVRELGNYYKVSIIFHLLKPEDIEKIIDKRVVVIRKRNRRQVKNLRDAEEYFSLGNERLELLKKLLVEEDCEEVKKVIERLKEIEEIAFR